MYRPQYQWNGDMGGIDMTQNLSTDSTSTYYSEMSSVAKQSMGSPYTNDGSCDSSSPLSEDHPPYAPPPDQYVSFGHHQPYQAQQSFSNDHLNLPNRSIAPLPSDQWLAPPPLYPRQFHTVPVPGPVPVSSSRADPPAYQQSSAGDEIRHTPDTLRWPDGTHLLDSYTFHVNKGKDPYFELLPGIAATMETPQRVYLQTYSDLQNKMYACKYPTKRCADKNGNTIYFNRSADLGRHLKAVHIPLSQQETLTCSRPNCNRDASDPFTRKDHYRGHLREYHREDIGKTTRRRNDTDAVWAERQRLWLRERKISSRSWRCEKCLLNNRVSRGWVCSESSCRAPCREDRRQARILKRAQEDEEELQRAAAKSAHAQVAQGQVGGGALCEVCNDTGFWVDDNSWPYVLCPNCQEGSKVDDYECFDRDGSGYSFTG